MWTEANRIAQRLKDAQGEVARLTQHLCVLITMKEGDHIRAKFNFGGRLIEQVGVVRVMSDASFFLELSTGALLLVEEAVYLEILTSCDAN